MEVECGATIGIHSDTGSAERLPSPYVAQRLGYGDVAWDQLFHSRFWKSITGRTEETHDFTGARARRKVA